MSIGRHCAKRAAHTREGLLHAVRLQGVRFARHSGRWQRYNRAVYLWQTVRERLPVVLVP